MGAVKRQLEYLIRCIAYDLVDLHDSPTNSRCEAMEDRLWAAWERRPEVLSRIARRQGWEIKEL